MGRLPLVGAGVSLVLIFTGIAEGRPAVTFLQAVGLIAIVAGLRLGWWLSIAAAVLLCALITDNADALTRFSVAFCTPALAGLFLLSEAHRSWTLRARARLMLTSSPLVAVPLAGLVLGLHVSIAVPVLATLTMSLIAGGLALHDGLLGMRRTQLPKASLYLLVSVVIGELLAGWRWHDRHVGALERAILAQAVHEHVEPALEESSQFLASQDPRGAEQPLRTALAALAVLEAERHMPLIDGEGLGAALEWLAERTQLMSGISVEVDAGGDYRGARPPLPVLQEAFRFVRGALRLAALDWNAEALVRIRVHTPTRLVVSVRARS
jgi:hypothetical protein